LKFDASVKHIVSEKLWAKSNKYKFIGFLKKTIRYYLYHLVEQKCFISEHATFLEKKHVLERSSGKTIELEEVEEPYTDIQIEHEHEVITLDVQLEAQEI
jgi:hypothetical protein